jgi:hypothetical protein
MVKSSESLRNKKLRYDEENLCLSGGKGHFLPIYRLQKAGS